MRSMTLEYQITTWPEIVKKTLSLCRKIKASGYKPDVLVFILRGGATPASILSDCLGIKNVVAVKAELYEEIGKPGKQVKIVQPLTVDVKDKSVLIIDDVSDTGMTLQAIVNHVKERGAREIRVATIHYKPWSKYVPDYFIEETKKWIVYPWEYHEFISEISQKITDSELKGEDEERAKRALERVQQLLRELNRED